MNPDQHSLWRILSPLLHRSSPFSNLQKETIETVTFLRILKEYFENFEKYQGITGVPAGIQLYGDVIGKQFS